MTARTKFGIVFCSTLLTTMLVIGYLMGKEQGDEGAYRPLAVYSEVLKHIKSDYVEDPDIDKVTRGALRGLVEYLDPLSSYLTSEQYKEFKKAQSNPDRGTGLSTGLVIHKRVGYTTVLSVLPNSSAAKADILPGDLIEAIDGLNTRVMPPAYLHTLLSGDPGSRVEVLVRSFRDSDEPKVHMLLRTEVELPPIEHKILEGAIGYLDIDILDEKRVENIGNRVKALESKGAKSLILDLRGNSVGETIQGITLANYFLDSGLISSLKGQQYPERKFEADSESTLTGLPIVVISDRTTAGAAEVAAAALLDNKRAQLVGERTYGLSAVQKTIELDDGALILSVARYHRPSGEAIQEGGVTPSHPLDPSDARRYRESTLPHQIEAPPLREEREPESEREDPFLKKAIEVLQEQAKADKKAA